MFQLNAPVVYYISFFNIPLHVSSNIVLIISPLTACALSGHLRRVTYKEPDAVFIQ